MIDDIKKKENPNTNLINLQSSSIKEIELNF